MQQLIHLSGSLSLSLCVCVSACVCVCVPVCASLSPVSAGKVAGGQAPHRPDAVLLTVPTAGPGPEDHAGRRRRSTSTDRVSLRGDLDTVTESEGNEGRPRGDSVGEREDLKESPQSLGLAR